MAVALRRIAVVAPDLSHAPIRRHRRLASIAHAHPIRVEARVGETRAADSFNQ